MLFFYLVFRFPLPIIISQMPHFFHLSSGACTEGHVAPSAKEGSDLSVYKGTITEFAQRTEEDEDKNSGRCIKKVRFVLHITSVSDKKQ
jgi:hypothetical protein